MAVETYILNEHESLLVEPSDLSRWHELVDKLGLEKQKELTSEEKSPIVFPVMTREMSQVYRILCPNRQELKDYKKEAVPLRVLEIADLCITEKYFEEIWVWHNYKEADPILVGSTNGYGGFSDDNIFLLARWGDELRAFSELKQMAWEKLAKNKKAQLNAFIAKAKMQIETVEDLSYVQVSGGNPNWVTNGDSMPF